jgi:hypothetical protein
MSDARPQLTRDDMTLLSQSCGELYWLLRENPETREKWAAMGQTPEQLNNFYERLLRSQVGPVENWSVDEIACAIQALTLTVQLKKQSSTNDAEPYRVLLDKFFE